MRVYLPALSDELHANQPTTRQGWTARIPAGTHPEQAEVYEDDAVTEACLDSLSLLRDEDAPAGIRRAHRRLVLAIDIPDTQARITSEEAADEDGVVFPVAVEKLDWNDVAALMVDDADAEEAVRRVIDAQDQNSADEAIAQLWEYAIGWFDIAERHTLAAALNP